MRLFLPLLFRLGATAVQASTVFDLTNNSGQATLFTTGTTFLNVDGNGLSMTVTGAVSVGSVDYGQLSQPFALNIVSSKRDRVKVDYILNITFSSPIPAAFALAAMLIRKRQHQPS